MTGPPILVVTGASGGLGQALCTRAAAAGWRVAAVSRKPPEPVADAVWPVAADVGTPEGARAALAACQEQFGRAPDALVGAAGNTLITPLHRTRDSAYRECIAANLDTAFYSLQAFVGALLDAGQGGAAVLVSSVAAGIGVANHEAIAAAKAGVEGLVRSAAATYAGAGIRVNGVAPGLYRTPLTAHLLRAEHSARQVAAQYPLGRHGEAEDVAGAVLWLLSAEAAWMTGQVLPVDGGFSAVRPLVRATGS